MDRTRWERLAPLTGVLAFVLTLVSVILLDSPDFLEKPDEVAKYYADDPGKIIAASYIGFLGTVAYIWFVGVLRSRLRRVEGPLGRLSAIAFGGGIASAALFFFIDAFNAAGAFRADEDGAIDPAVAASLYDMSSVMINASGFAASVLVLATSALALRTGGTVLPSWLAWIGVLIGIGCLTPIAYIFLGLYLLWILAVAVMLYVRPVLTGPGETPVARAPV
jgi:hypothetical protein